MRLQAGDSAGDRRDFCRFRDNARQLVYRTRDDASWLRLARLRIPAYANRLDNVTLPLHVWICNIVVVLPSGLEDIGTLPSRISARVKNRDA